MCVIERKTDRYEKSMGTKEKKRERKKRETATETGRQKYICIHMFTCVLFPTCQQKVFYASESECMQPHRRPDRKQALGKRLQKIK